MEIVFGVLGQTMMRMHGNMTVNWSTPRTRRFLAALLTEPGRRMSISTLVEWIWDETEQRPQNPAATVYQNITRLRQALRAAQVPATVAGASGAYALHVDPHLIDYVASREIMAEARIHSDRGDHRRACDVAHTALALWRDNPIADLTTARADSWRASLTRTDWIPTNAFALSAQLADGQPAAALRRLDELEHDHSDELSFAKLRLRALHALGRYSESDQYYLDKFKDFRNSDHVRAADELRALQDQLMESGASADSVVTGERGLSSRADDQVGPVRHLPPDIENFTGRGSILAALDTLTTDVSGAARPAVVAMTGLPGVGKTTTVVRWAHHASPRFPHGVIVLDLHGVGQARRIEASDVVDTLLAALDYPVDHIVGHAGRAAKLTALLGRRRMLVVLDNVEDTAHVQPLLSVLGACTVVITSRRRLSTLSMRHNVPIVTIEPLSVTESLDLLAARIGPRSFSEPEALSALAQLCRGLPLALTLVAERAAGRAGIRLRTLAQQLDDPDTLLTIGDDGDGTETSLLSAFSLSYVAFNDAEQRLFRLIGVHPGAEVTTEALAAAGGTSVSATRRSLDVLLAAQLIQHPGALDRYRIHDLFHLYAATLAAQSPGVEHDRTRLLSFYLHSAFNAHVTLYPYRDRPPMLAIAEGCVPLTFSEPAAARQWFLQERSTLNTLVDYAADHDLHGYAWRLPHFISEIQDRFGFYDDIIAGLTTAVKSAATIGDVMAEASSLNDLAQVHMLVGNDGDADHCLRQAYALVTTHDMEVGKLVVLLNMARRHHHAGRSREALELYHQCLRLASETGSADHRASAVHRLADALADAGYLEDALGHYRRALQLRRHLGDISGQVAIHTALGALETQRGRYGEGDAHCARAMALLEKAQHLPATMKLYTVLAQLAHAQRQDRVALRHAQHAVELAERAHHATGQARALDTLGQILADRGNAPDAHDIWIRAAQLYHDRERHAKAAKVEARLADLVARTPIVPNVRTGDEDTVAIPAPPRHADRRHTNR